jgi:hypothetical protein
VDATTEVRDPLFQSAECWGWEFVEPRPPKPSAELLREPEWIEPPPPNPRQWQPVDTSSSQQANRYFWGGGISLFFALFLFADVRTIIIGVGLLGLGAWLIYRGTLVRKEPVIVRNTQLEEYQKFREEQWRAFSGVHTAWKERVDGHNRLEHQRYQTEPMWLPVRPREASSRVDVFGGTKSGWASLITTVGSTLLGERTSLTILDFSEHEIAFELSNRAAQCGRQAHLLLLPKDLRHIDLLAGLDAEQVVDALTSAIHATSDLQRESRESLTLDADVLSIVVGSLQGQYTVPRILAGIRVLLGNYDPDEKTLSDREWSPIQKEVDFIGATEVQRGRLGLLRAFLNLLGDMAQGDPGEDLLPAARIDPSRDLYVIATEMTDNNRRKELLSTLTFQALRHNLHALRQRNGWRHLVVVAGADRMGLRNLEQFAGEAASSETRVLYLFEHLRDDVRPLVGTDGASTIFMRLGNDEEARKAAEHVGKAHKFVLGQLTRSVGRTFSDARGVTTGEQLGEAYTSGYNYARGLSSGAQGFSTNATSGFSSSFTTSRSTSWAETITQSRAITETGGEVQQRVYEFSKEPTELQALAPTALLLVQHTDSTKRVVAADCNPGIASLPRVAFERPRNATKRLQARPQTHDRP